MRAGDARGGDGRGFPPLVGEMSEGQRGRASSWGTLVVALAFEFCTVKMTG